MTPSNGSWCTIPPNIISHDIREGIVQTYTSSEYNRASDVERKVTRVHCIVVQLVCYSQSCDPENQGRHGERQRGRNEETNHMKKVIKAEQRERRKAKLQKAEKKKRMNLKVT